VSLRETYTQKVALTPEKNLQLLEDAFSERGRAKGPEKPYSSGCVGGEHLGFSVSGALG
jgi:hypothetical protein